MDIGHLGKSVYEEDGTLQAAVDLFGEDASCAPGIAYHPYGFLGRPKDPDTDPKSGAITNGPRTLYYFEGSTLHTMPLDDPRVTRNLQRLQKGSSMQYSSGQSRVVCDQNGAVTLYTTDNNGPSGKSVYFRISPTEMRFVSPWGSMVFDATGFHVRDQSGARIDLGAIGGIPSPLSQIANYATISAAQVNVVGSLVNLGPKGAKLPIAACPLAPPGLPLGAIPTTGVFVTAP